MGPISEPTVQVSLDYDPNLAPGISQGFVDAVLRSSSPVVMHELLNKLGARIARMNVTEGSKVLYNITEGVSRTPSNTPFESLKDQSSCDLVDLALKPGAYRTAGGQKLTCIGSELMFGISIIASKQGVNEALFLPPILKLEMVLKEYVLNSQGNKLTR